MKKRSWRKTSAALAFAAGLASMSGVAGAAPTQVEGAIGGGIVPWALLPSQSPTGFFTNVFTNDFSIFSIGGSFELLDRVELSYARMHVGIGGSNAEKALSNRFGQENEVDVDVFGGKFKVIEMTDTWPQIAIGAQYKHSDINDATLNGIGSDDDDGIDVYAAATKLFDIGKYKAVGNVVVRGTQANQLGVLGFDDDYDVVAETTLGFFLTEDLAFGMEYRMKPDNLDKPGKLRLKEDDWWDVWMVWFPHDNLTVTAAYANLGDVIAEASDVGVNLGTPAGTSLTTTEGEDEQGLFLSLQLSFDMF